MSESNKNTRITNFELSLSLHRSFCRVAHSYFLSYFNCQNRNKITVDTIDQAIDECGRLVTKRLIIRQYNVPFGFRFFFNSIESYKMLEVSKLCPRSSTLTITNYISSRFDKYLKIKEEVSYFPSPIKPQNDTFLIKKVQGINTGLLFPASIT